MSFIGKLGNARTLANKLTLSRLAAVPVIYFLYLLDLEFFKFIASWCFLAAAITDFLDGYIARKYDGITTLGQLLDPVADKVLVMASLLLLVGEQKISGVFILLPAIIIAREIFISGVRLLALERRITISVRNSGKWKTALQSTAIFCLMMQSNPYIIAPFKEVGWISLWASTLLSLYSAFQYWDYFWKENKKEFTS